ncbi:MAG: tRNA uracil 4-sulfurtransferase ThiI [Myxococcota bacterium]
MATPTESTGSLVLARYSGELTTKARPTRAYFSKRLAANVKDGLRALGIRSRIERGHDRLRIQLASTDDATRALPVLSRTFGVQSVVGAIELPWSSTDDIVREGVRLFADAVAGRRFAVRARRVGDRARIAASSSDVARALGAALAPRAAGVDLDDPEVAVHVEVAPGRAHFFRDVARGPGGLPLGVEGRAVALVSGGFDSAVAAWQLLRRGVALDYVFCNLGGRTHELGTMRVAKHLADAWSYGTRPQLHSVDFDSVSADLQRACTTRYWQVVLKRRMLRAAELVAAERGAAAIATGEAIGQVSSQTLQNLAVISRATTVPILRPLVGMNKDDILASARAIGTFELSKVVGEYCALVPSKPATAATLGAIEAEETKLDAGLLDAAVAARSVFDLRALDLATLDDPTLQVDDVPEGATLLDLRSKPAYQTWHAPGALFLDFADAVRAYASFDRAHRYALYCEFGLKSGHLAELMRAEGMQAVSIRGGAAALRRRLDAARARDVGSE